MIKKNCKAIRFPPVYDKFKGIQYQKNLLTIALSFLGFWIIQYTFSNSGMIGLLLAAAGALLIGALSYMLIAKKTSITKKQTPINEKTQEKKRHFIAIASGKGGVGKTTIAANLGAALAKLGNKVTIIDMDLAMPNLEIITGLRNPPVGLLDVLEGRLGLEHVVYTGPMGTKVIPPGVMLDGYSGDNTEKIRELLKELPLKSDFIILDMPPGREAVDVLWGEIEALLVANPDKASVLDALNMKVLLEKKGVKVLGAVLNRAEHDERWIDEIERMLETSVVAVIPESKTVKTALESEECFVVAEPESAPSKEIMGLAKEIAPED